MLMPTLGTNTLASLLWGLGCWDELQSPLISHSAQPWDWSFFDWVALWLPVLFLRDLSQLLMSKVVSANSICFLLVHSWATSSPYLVPMYVAIFSIYVQSMFPSLPLFPKPMLKMCPSRSLQAPSSDAFLGTFDEVFLAWPPWLPCPPLALRPPQPVSFPWAILRWNL